MVQQQGFWLSAVPSSLLHTTWEEMPPIPHEVVPIPACSAHHGLFSWYHCPLRARPWALVTGYLTE